ncbi:MAG: glycosyltransferase family 52 [Halioglobus sp.]
MERVKNLFICATPLQSLIAAKIIEVRKLEKTDCFLFYYSKVRNSKIDYYYQSLSEKCTQSTFHECQGGIHRRAAIARNFFQEVDYTNVYFASAHSIYVQWALSQKKHVKIFTFDDGNANLTPVSRLNTKYGHSLKKHIASMFLGNTYSIDKIKAETIEHYTIYPDYRNNISDNLKPLDLFDMAGNCAQVGRCAVVLGTVFDDAFGSNNAENVQSRLNGFMNSLDQDTFFIPHPRDKHVRAGNYQIIEFDRIAEELIVDLHKNYGTIDLYGFCSSTQIHLAKCDYINNYFFSTYYEQDSIGAMREHCNEIGIKPKEVINIDLF